jgi:uncharacterized protein YceK
MRIAALTFAVACAILSGCATTPSGNLDAAKAQVFATERAFAKTMADRDYAAFTSFLAADAVFFSGPEP